MKPKKLHHTYADNERLPDNRPANVNKTFELSRRKKINYHTQKSMTWARELSLNKKVGLSPLWPLTGQRMAFIFSPRNRYNLNALV